MQKKKTKKQSKKQRSVSQVISEVSEKVKTTSASPKNVDKETEYQRTFLQSVIDGVTDPIIVVGADFHIKLMNKAAREFSQCSDAGSSPKCHQFMFGLSEPCEGQNRSCPLSRVKSTRVPVTEELVHVFPNGKTRIFEILASPMLSAEGEFLGVVESLRDITIRKNYEAHLLKDHDELERHVEERTAELIKINASLTREVLDRQRVEDELRKSKEQAELIYRVIPSAIFTVDTERRITNWNDKAERVTGYTRDEVIGRKCEFFALKPCTEVCGVFSPHVDKPIIARECEIRTKEGEVLTISKNADLLHDLDGSVIGAVESFTNITPLKQVAEELRTERDKFSGMLSAMGQGMHILNSNFDIEYQNDVLKKAFGDKIGHKCYEVYKQRDVPCDVCRMHIAIESNEIQRTEEIMTNGRHYEQSYAPFSDVDGQMKTLILLRDITEEKAYQAETMRAGQLASIGELAAGVAHEINNPINGIINYAQILLDETESNPMQSEMLGRLIREGERIADIVTNLLSFARQHGEDVEDVAIESVFDDAMALISHQFMKDGISVNVDLPPDLPEVRVNHQQLQQVLLNLLSNSRHALNKRYSGKDPQKKIMIRCAPYTYKGKLFVRTLFTDYGTGIPKEVIGHIFDPFFSSKEPGEGTGLGLSISHGLVRNFRGFMRVESEENEFTTIIVELPAVVSADK